VRLLSRPDLARHALAVFSALPHLPEARRWACSSAATGPVRLRSPGQPDIVITPAHERLLLLWGRHPHCLRDPRNPPETPGDLLKRLAARE